MFSTVRPTSAVPHEKMVEPGLPGHQIDGSKEQSIIPTQLAKLLMRKAGCEGAAIAVGRLSLLSGLLQLWKG